MPIVRTYSQLLTAIFIPLLFAVSFNTISWNKSAIQSEKEIARKSYFLCVCAWKWHERIRMRKWKRKTLQYTISIPTTNHPIETEKKKYENFVVHEDGIHEIKLKIERSLPANVYCVLETETHSQCWRRSCQTALHYHHHRHQTTWPNTITQSLRFVSPVVPLHSSLHQR